MCCMTFSVFQLRVRIGNQSFGGIAFASETLILNCVSSKTRIESTVLLTVSTNPETFDELRRNML